MADAIILNTTFLRISVNLNVELDNHVLEPMSFTNLTSETTDSGLFEGWPAPVAAFPGVGIFGANKKKNVLVVFYQGSSEPQIYDIRSSVSTTLDLYLYVMGQDITGADQTGSTKGIVVRQASDDVVAEVMRSVPAPVFLIPPS